MGLSFQFWVLGSGLGIYGSLGFGGQSEAFCNLEDSSESKVLAAPPPPNKKTKTVSGSCSAKTGEVFGVSKKHLQAPPPPKEHIP